MNGKTRKNSANVFIWLSVVPVGAASGPLDQDLSCAGGFCLQNLWSRKEAGQSGGVHSESTHSHVCHQSTDVLLRGGLGSLHHLSTGKLSHSGFKRGESTESEIHTQK